MHFRQIQSWLALAVLFLALVVGMTYTATKALRDDLAVAESTYDARNAYSDTLFVVGNNVDQQLWQGYLDNRRRIDSLEMQIAVAKSRRDSLSRHIRQIDEAMAAQARAIQRLR